jgi:hypothetical protein
LRQGNFGRTTATTAETREAALAIVSLCWCCLFGVLEKGNQMIRGENKSEKVINIRRKKKSLVWIREAVFRPSF